MQDDQKILDRLGRMEQLMEELLHRETVKDWYTTEDFSKIVGKAEFTVREWCRLGRISAEKRQSGRGRFQAWVISHVELRRYQHEGLISVQRDYHSAK